MQDVSILSFDFSIASEAHAAPKRPERQKEDTMQEVPILSYDFSHERRNNTGIGQNTEVCLNYGVDYDFGALQEIQESPCKKFKGALATLFENQEPKKEEPKKEEPKKEDNKRKAEDTEEKEAKKPKKDEPKKEDTEEVKKEDQEDSAIIAKNVTAEDFTLNLPETCETLLGMLGTQVQERIAASEATQIASQETFDSQDTYNEDVHERDRKIAKCVDWWRGEQFTKRVWGTFGLLGDDLLCEDWLNVDCYRSQKYDGLNVETATKVAIQFAFDVVRGREFKIGITADIKHRWERPDIDKFGNAVGYMHNGYRRMYIVHVSDYGKADLSIDKFEKDPEMQRQLKARDRSAGRMEMQMVDALRHLPGCQNTGPGNEAATNKNGDMATYIVVA